VGAGVSVQTSQEHKPEPPDRTGTGGCSEDQHENTLNEARARQAADQSCAKALHDDVLELLADLIVERIRAAERQGADE